MRIAILVSTMAVGGVLSACGGTHLTQAKVSSVEAAVRAAEEVGAPALPQAALHLQLAKEQTENAQRLDKVGEGQAADLELTRALADAELAIQLAQTDRERLNAEAAWVKVKESRARQSAN